LIFGCSARDLADQVALEILVRLLDPIRWKVELVPPGTLTAELLELVAAKQPALVCIATIPPGGLAHTRYLCKRLRARFPDLRIIVGRWGKEAGTEDAASLCEAGALSTATTLSETRRQLLSLLPVLVHRRDPQEDGEPADGRDPIAAPPGAIPTAPPWCEIASPAASS